MTHVDMGDIIRGYIRDNHALGVKAREYVSHGKLVPSDVVEQMLFDYLESDYCLSRIMLDGFPRSLDQAEGLGEYLEGRGESLNTVINLTATVETLISRLSGRRLCRACGAVYHMEFNRPPDDGVCGACGKNELYQREDDRPDTVRARLETYNQETAPLIEYFRRMGVLRDVDGQRNIETVSADIARIIQESGPKDA
jgi:adenylate kinase